MLLREGKAIGGTKEGVGRRQEGRQARRTQRVRAVQASPTFNEQPNMRDMQDSSPTLSLENIRR